MDKSYIIKSRYLVSGEGWKLDTISFNGSYEAAGREASRIARELDQQYGDSHFWTVDVTSATSGGSFFQLFHGRLS